MINRPRPKLLAAACAAVTVACAGAEEANVPFSVAEVGFETPESVLHDQMADVYLVANINGDPFGKDGNGFISRVAPNGSVEALKWIDGGASGVTLNAPKGMGISGDTLFVADIDAVRMFHRTTGAPLGAREIEGATFLNDIAVGPDGTVYVTDSGLKEGFEPSGTDALYRFGPNGEAIALAESRDLGRPNGIHAGARNIVLVTFGSGEAFSIDPRSGLGNALPSPPMGQLDGVWRLADGSVLMSSWEGQCVYRMAKNGEYSVVVDSVEAPADIGYDARRNRVLIPLFNANRLEIRPLEMER